MKSFKLYSILIVLAILSCSTNNDGNDANNLANFVPQISCNANVVGPTAAYWDYANSVPPPLTQVPILESVNGQFIHSQHPYLGFPLPQGYQGFEAQDAQTAPLGVNVIRNDNAAIWRYVPLSTFPINFSLNEIIAREINGMFAFYNFNGNFEVLCTHTPTPISELGVNRFFTSRLIRFGNFTGLVWVHVVQVEGLPTLSVASSVSAGPTNEYDNLVRDIFFPLSFQLLVSDRETLSDRDNDGTPDIFDSAPDDPKIQ